MPEVSAGSLDQAVVESAKLARSILQGYEWRTQQMDSMLASLWTHLFIKGGAYLKLTWNPKGGKRLPDAPVYLLDEAGEPVPEFDPYTGMPTGQFQVDTNPFTGAPKTRKDYEGVNRLRVVDIGSVVSDDSCGEVAEDALWLIEQSWQAPAFLQSTYPGSYVQPKSRTSDLIGTVPRRLMQREDESAEVLECWIRGGNNYGGLEFESDYKIIVADGQTLAHGPSQYDYFPYRLVRASRTPGTLSCSTFMSDVRKVNHLLNLTASHVATSNANAGAPVWTIHTESKVKSIATSTTPGGVVEHATPQGLMPPTRHDGRSVASSCMGFMNYLYQAMQDVGAAHAGGSLGGNAPGVEAAIHAQEVNERDMAALGGMAQEVASAMEWWGENSLRNWQRFRPIKSQVSITGALAASEVAEFGGMDVHDSFIYSVPINAVLPQSRAVKFQTNFVLWQNKFLTKREFMQREGHQEGEEVTLDGLHANAARDENRLIMQGGAAALFAPEYMQLMMLHDPEVHFEEHVRFILAPDTPMEAKLAAMQHLMEHDAIVEQAMQQQQQEAMAAAGEDGDGNDSEAPSQDADPAGQPGTPNNPAGPAPAAGSMAEEPNA
jgi:hypothetical protein